MRDSRVGVAEALADHVHGRSAAQQGGGVRVPQVVQPDVRRRALAEGLGAALQVRLECPEDALRVQVVAFVVAE